MSGFYGDLLDVVHEFMVDVGIFCILSDPNADDYQPAPHTSLNSQFIRMDAIFRNCPCGKKSWPVPLVLEVTDVSEAAFMQALDRSWPEERTQDCLINKNEQLFCLIPIVWKWPGGERAALVIIADSKQWYYDPAWSEKEEGTPIAILRSYMSRYSLLKEPVLSPLLVDGRVQDGVNLETAIIAACNNPNVAHGIRPPSTLPCLIFAAIAWRCGFTDPNIIARSLTIWFMSPGGPRANSLNVSGSVICRTPIRLLSWEANLTLAIKENNIRSILQLLGLKVPWNRTALRPCGFLISSGLLYTRLCAESVANEAALCEKHSKEILHKKPIQELESALRPGPVLYTNRVYTY